MQNLDRQDSSNPYASPRTDLTPAEDTEIPYGWFCFKAPELKKLPFAEAGRVHRYCYFRYGLKSRVTVLGMLMMGFLGGLSVILALYLQHSFGHKLPVVFIILCSPLAGFGGLIWGGLATAHLRPYYAQCIREGWHLKPEKQEPQVIISVPGESE